MSRVIMFLQMLMLMFAIFLYDMTLFWVAAAILGLFVTAYYIQGLQNNENRRKTMVQKFIEQANKNRDNEERLKAINDVAIAVLTTEEYVVFATTVKF